MFSWLSFGWLKFLFKHWRIIGTAVAVASAAYGGWYEKGVRDTAAQEKTIQRNAALYAKQVSELNAKIKSQNTATQSRESELSKALAESQSNAEALQREIATQKPIVVSKLVKVPVGGVCPPTHDVDWVRFAAEYNAAASGAATGAPESGHGRVP